MEAGWLGCVLVNRCWWLNLASGNYEAFVILMPDPFLEFTLVFILVFQGFAGAAFDWFKGQWMFV